MLLLLKGNAENDEERPSYISGGKRVDREGRRREGRQGEVREGGYLSLDFAF